MESRRARAIAALVATAAFAGCARDGSEDTAGVGPAGAELALKNGAIYTMDAARSWAEAIVIDQGRIIYVGSDAGAEAYIGARTRLVDLRGRMVVPGFQDAHVHPILGGLEANGCDLKAADTVEEYLAVIRDYAAQHPDEPWIQGGGWLMSAFGPGAQARKELIDAVVPDRPVMLWSTDGHTLWANSKALAIAGVSADTPDPPDGSIDRDPKTGEPIGSLQEGAASLVADQAPPATDAMRDAALRYALEMLNGYGITGVLDASVSEDDLRAYQRLDQAGALSLQVVGAIVWDSGRGLEQLADLRRLREEYGQGRVRADTVKIYVDGVMENYTAVVLEPYRLPGRKDARGIPMIEPQALVEAVTRLDAEGFQVHFHAIGDGAVRMALDAVEAARTANGARGLRHQISHIQLIHPDDQPRFRKLGVVANFQPLWAYADEYVTELTLPFISRQVAGYMYPIASMHRHGAVVAFGSDWSVSSANPLEEMETAITRMGALGETATPWMPEERIGLRDALAAFTGNAAFAIRNEASTGSLAVGKRADLAVLDRNLFELPAAGLSDAKVLLTLFEGRAVHGELGAL